jgi:hypothetical protein
MPKDKKIYRAKETLPTTEIVASKHLFGNFELPINLQDNTKVVTTSKRKNNAEQLKKENIKWKHYFPPKLSNIQTDNTNVQINTNKDFPIVPETKKVMDDRAEQVSLEKTNNPTIKDKISTELQIPLRMLASPVNSAKDISNFLFGTKYEGNYKKAVEYTNFLNDPKISDEEKVKYKEDVILNLTNNALINAATLELGYLAQTGKFLTLNTLAKQGSQAALASDVLQIYKADWDKLKSGDVYEILDLVTNIVGAGVKIGDNFDASTILYNIQNFKTLPLLDKIDTYKDILALTSTLFGQTQREDLPKQENYEKQKK